MNVRSQTKVKWLTTAVAASIIVVAGLAGWGECRLSAANPAPAIAERSTLAAPAGLPSVPAAGQAALLGHPDFYPSPEHPIGWLGDGSGRFPGAAPPTEWNLATGKNIRWMTPLPMPSNAAPIVVGKKVFVLSDPDLLICCDTETGKVLWQRECFVDIFPHLATKPAEEVKSLREAFVRSLDVNYYVYEGGLDSCFPKNSGVWKAAAARLPDDKGLVERVARFARPHPDLLECHNTSETDKVRKSKFDDLLLSAKLPRGTSDSDFDWLTCTFTPPVSDGRRIFVRLLRHTVVCCDLDGKHLWTWKLPDSDWKDKLGVNTVPLYLSGNRLYVWFGNGMAAIDVATGKTVAEIRRDEKKGIDLTSMGDHGQQFVIVNIDGEPHFLIGARYGDGGSLVRVKDLAWVGKVASGPSLSAAGSVVAGGLIVSAQGDYYVKHKTGASAARLVRDGGAWKLEQVWWTMKGGKGEVPEWKAPAGGFVNGSLNLGGKADPSMSWRGVVVAGERVFTVGNGHKVVQFDLKTGAVLDICVTVKESCQNTNEPVLAGGKVLVPTWSGYTSVFDAVTGKFLSANLGEPMHGASVLPQGNRVYLRGWCNLVCVGER